MAYRESTGGSASIRPGKRKGDYPTSTMSPDMLTWQPKPTTDLIHTSDRADPLRLSPTLATQCLPLDLRPQYRSLKVQATTSTQQVENRSTSVLSLITLTPDLCLADPERPHLHYQSDQPQVVWLQVSAHRPHRLRGGVSLWPALSFRVVMWGVRRHHPQLWAVWGC